MTISKLEKLSLCFDIEEFHLKFIETRLITHGYIGDPREMMRIKRYDTAPVLRAELRNALDESVHLTLLNPIKFIMREKFYYESDQETEELKILESSNVILSPQDAHRGRFQYLWQPGDTDTPGPYIAEFEILLNGLESNGFGPFVLEDGQTLELSIDGGTIQSFTFNTADFEDIAAATAEEIVDVLNATLTGATAIATDAARRILIQTNNTSSEGSVQLTGGTALTELDFDQELRQNRKISLPECGLLINIVDDLDEF